MLKEARRIFFVGLGGIGVSGLARILSGKKFKVSGSDAAASEITGRLSEEGMTVFIGHREQNLPDDTELLIHSAAVPGDNAERTKARHLGIAELSYPQAVGELAKDYKVIAVAGTNGKTTTTAMIATIIEAVGLDPTVLVGSQILAWGSNARVGYGKYFVLEADEYRRAFLNYPADVAVITNIELDHLDYFKDLVDIKTAFQEFSALLKPGGTVVYNLANINTVEAVKNLAGKKVGFSAADLGGVKLNVPGEFNRENAAAAAAVCRSLGIPEEKIRTGLEKFTGTWRRFEKVGVVGKTEIISDYAHHPAAVTVTLKAVSEVYRGRKVLVVFQPHQHNRTKKLFKEFVQSFCQSVLDDFIICEIFDVVGREDSTDQDVSSNDLVKELAKCGKQASYAKNLADCEQQVKAVLPNYDTIVFMGAGDIYKVANGIADKPVGS